MTPTMVLKFPERRETRATSCLSTMERPVTTPRVISEIDKREFCQITFVLNAQKLDVLEDALV